MILAVVPMSEMITIFKNIVSGIILELEDFQIFEGVSLFDFILIILFLSILIPIIINIAKRGKSE